MPSARLPSHARHRGTTSLADVDAGCLATADTARPLEFGCVGPIPSVLLGMCAYDAAARGADRSSTDSSRCRVMRRIRAVLPKAPR